jgi:Cdc6-like AAA superfamily ATPase
MTDSDEESIPGTNRRTPNILITGTPGVGKTSTASLIAEKLDYKHVNVSYSYFNLKIGGLQ